VAAWPPTILPEFFVVILSHCIRVSCWYFAIDDTAFVPNPFKFIKGSDVLFTGC